MRYIVMKEMKASTKIGKNIYLQDMFFIIAYFAATYMMSALVYSSLQLPYYLFSITMGIVLRAPSIYNPKKRNYESLFILLRKNYKVYKPIININNCSSMEEIEKHLDI